MNAGQVEQLNRGRPDGSRAWLAGLVALLVISEILYLALVRLNAVNGAASVLKFLALLGALFALYAAAHLFVRRAGGPSPMILAVIAAGAVAFRLTLLPAGLPHDAEPQEIAAGLRADLAGDEVAFERFLLFDSDIWRSLWDGHVGAHGVNPYRFAPSDAALDALADADRAGLADHRAMWSDVRDNINHPSVPSIYPPLAQAVFRFSHWLAPGSVLAMKILLVFFDLLAVLFLALTLRQVGRPITDVLLYAWNPLVIKVFAGSGHMDAVLVAALAATAYFLARNSRAMAAATYGLAILAKLSPVILLPFVLKRVGWRRLALSGAIVIAAYLPFLDAGWAVFEGLRTFARDWQFNAGPFALFRWLASLVSNSPDVVARAVSGLAVLAVVAWLAWRDGGDNRTFANHGVVALGALLLLGPAVMPWYVAWLLPLAIIAGTRVWVYFSALVCLAFLVMIDQTEHAWALILEYGGFVFLLTCSAPGVRRLLTTNFPQTFGKSEDRMCIEKPWGAVPFQPK
ncbi:MAG: DUF2029 domain-containing protein [Acidobacteria bacterium]|nr:DUF2029 domain-containing protein [Acidobacteriota bacterium]